MTERMLFSNITIYCTKCVDLPFFFFSFSFQMSSFLQITVAMHNFELPFSFEGTVKLLNSCNVVNNFAGNT